MRETAETIEKILIEIVEDLIQDWGLDLEQGVNRNTLLVNDLEFASVDVIQLCVAVEQHFEQKLGFQSLLMVNGSYVRDLALGQMMEFVERRLRELAA